jgi:hypothetical protein
VNSILSQLQEVLDESTTTNDEVALHCSRYDTLINELYVAYVDECVFIYL